VVQEVCLFGKIGCTCIYICVCVGRKMLAGGEPVGVLVTCTGQCLGVIAQMGVQLNHMEFGTSANTY